MRRYRALAVVLCLVLLYVRARTDGLMSTANGEWPTYGGDLASTRYSPLAQIDATNFSTLDIAWRFKTSSFGPRPEYNLQSTPLVVNGMLYTTAGTRKAVIALDAATGEMRWMHGVQEGARGESAPRPLSGRGLAYWTDGKAGRIFYVTQGYQLIGLDALTGVPVPGFGRNGLVDLKTDADQPIEADGNDIGLQAAPIISGNTIVIGAAHLNGRVPKSRQNVKGHVRAYDTRSGRRLWTFHTIPAPGEVGNDSWENDSWSYTGNTGVWGQMTIDEARGVVYIPTETPTGDEYGGHRPGNNLFANSLVALDLATGKRLWHFQTSHHDIWDYDLPCAPILLDIRVGGVMRQAIAQPTKQGFVFVLDRYTGAPIWPIEERAVPQSDAPGEKTSPTQPFPSRPPAFDRQGVTVDDLIDFTPELRAEAIKVTARYRLGPLFTPAAVSQAGGPLGTLMLPQTTGGANWQGASADPETGVLYVFSNTEIGAIGLVKSSRSDMDWVEGSVASGGAGAGEGGPELNVSGLPLVKPPWGRITALDLNRGDMVWQIAHGETPDAVSNHPALKGLTLPRTGRPGRIGVLTTKTLVVAGEGGFATTPRGRGAMLRAYDKATGREVGAVYMPAPQTGSPNTYMLNGTQYLVIAVGGAGYPSELIAFRLGVKN